MPSRKLNSDNANNQQINPETMLDELITIRQLLVILLTKLGSDSGEIGDALRIEPRRIREWIAFQGIKPISENAEKKTNKKAKRLSKKINKEQNAEIEKAVEELETESLNI